MLTAGLGFRVHSGWACLAVVALSTDRTLVVERKRVDMMDHRMRGALQPYHAAKDMQLAEAQEFLEQCATTTRTIASMSLEKAASEIAGNGYKVVASCILLSSGRPTDDLAATLRSHAMIHTAEGHFFRNALQKSCEACGVQVLGVKEKELLNRAAKMICISPAAIDQRISELGKRIGPPWRQDEKLCTIAGWLALASSPAQLA